MNILNEGMESVSRRDRSYQAQPGTLLVLPHISRGIRCGCHDPEQIGLVSSPAQSRDPV